MASIEPEGTAQASNGQDQNHQLTVCFVWFCDCTSITLMMFYTVDTHGRCGNSSTPVSKKRGVYFCTNGWNYLSVCYNNML